MTTEHEASRTLVKSPPELWAECSDAGSLARHLGEFGEIRITRLDPETAVAWEGERASGTVRIEPSAWGTRVTLTASTETEEATAVVEETVVVEEPPAVAEEPAEEEPTGLVEAESVAPEAAAVVDDATQLPEAPLPLRRRERLMARMRAFLRPVAAAPVSVAEPEAVVEPAEPEAVVEPDVSVAEPDVVPEPVSEPVESPRPSDVSVSRGVQQSDSSSVEPELDTVAVLAAALESLGQAHHRPFSRA
jgi:hypothetical protein